MRDALDEDYPEWALHFDRPVRGFPTKLQYRSAELCGEMTTNVKRLSQIIQKIQIDAVGTP